MLHFNQLEKYHILSVLHESRRNYICKGETDGKLPVILKISHNEYPGEKEVAIFRHEYEIVKNMEHAPGIITFYEFIKDQNRCAIVMEDIQGTALNLFMKETKINFDLFFELAFKITGALAEIHKNQIIHKDLKPENIIYNSQTNELRIIDFSLSSSLLKETQELLISGDTIGTFAYISPEQTGRMNRSIDYRSDFYSLGATFYKLLTGLLPFTTNDALEMIHCHIAQNATAPHELFPEIPVPLSQVILKLMAKMAEDRYQSITGLEWDLRQCYQAIKENKTQNIFFIGCNDIPGTLIIPEKIYGRDEEIKTLFKCYKRMAEGKKEILIIAGEGGVGKSTLVYEFERKLIGKKIFIVHGKYDEFIKDRPYPAIIQALTALIRQLLTEQEALLETWKQKLLNVLGNLGQLLIDIIPELELIIGKQPTPEKVSAENTAKRFLHAFINFIKIFTTRDSPLVLHLDDLQWVDDTSIKLLEALVLDHEIEALLLICTCRNMEMKESHSFFRLLANIKEKGMNWQEMHISGLEPYTISRMLEDFFNKNISATTELAQYIYRKTGGNPFFIIQFVKTLYEKKYIYFDKQWQWDTAKIIQEQATANMPDLLLKKIHMFPDNIQELLKLMSCMGHRIKTAYLVMLTGITESGLTGRLKPLFNEGILVKSGDYIQFAHNRIRETIYALIDKTNSCHYHYRIGNALLADYDPQQAGNNVFKLVMHWNQARSMMSSAEQFRLLELNLYAAARAREAIAYDAMLSYLLICKELLPADCWQSAYPFALQVYEGLAEAEYKNNEYRKAEKFCNLIIHKARNIDDRVNAYMVKGNYLLAVNREKEALHLHLEVLKALGIMLPVPPLRLPFIILKTLKLICLFRNNIEKLYGDKPTTDRRVINTMQVLCNIIPYLFTSSFFMNILLQLIATDFSIKHKAAQFAGHALLGWSFLLYFLKKHKAAKTTFASGLAYAKKFHMTFMTGVIRWFEARMILYWSTHIKRSSEVMEESLEIFTSNGYYQYAQGVFYTIHDCFLTSGENREKVDVFFHKNYNFFIRQRHIASEKAVLLFRQFQHILLGKTHSFFILGENADKETDFVTYCKEAHNLPLLFYFYFYKFFLLFIAGRYREALLFGVQANKYRSLLIHINITPFFELLYALALIQEQNCRTGVIKQIQKKLHSYAARNPVNFLHMSLLLDAEIARVRGRTNQALILYNRAVDEAGKQDFPNILALAHEFSAQFYSILGHTRICSWHLNAAYDYYKQWGIIPKLSYLEQQYSSVLSKSRNNTVPDLLSSSPVSVSASSSNNLVDLVSIIKASQVISGEIEMPRLVSQLIDIVSANVGADKGILILKNNLQKLQVEAVFLTKNRAQKTVMLSQSLEECPWLSPAIVRYVVKTGENLILFNAGKEGAFTRDPYILKNRTLSVLCTPIMKQNELIGVLYLENNLITHAFSEQHLEIVKILAGQAAIAIENARLYKNIQESESKYRTILESIDEGYFETNLRGAFIFVNDALCTITGYPKKELISKNFRSLLKQASRKKVFTTFYKVYKNSLSLKSENLLVIKKDGSLITIEISISLIKNQANLVTGFRGICQDVTEKKAAEQLKIAKDIAVAANKAKSEFLANMSHEMRSPLNAILGFTDLLGTHTKDRVAKGYLSALAYSGETLLNLINDILDLSRIEAGKIFLQQTVINVPAFLEKIKQTFIHTAHKKNLKFLIETAPSLPEYIITDELRLRQILHNLVNNAIKFTDQGFIKIRVCQEHPETTASNVHLLFSVQDTGIGIPKDQQQLIFETFRQREGQDSKKYGGTGLGLSISKRLVELMNGSITVISEPGEGAIFSFVLKDVAVALTDKQPGNNKNPDINTIQFKNRVILIADDHEENRILLTDYLKNTGITVFHAADGKEALEKIFTCNPDLILMDIRMPVINGYDAMLAIKTNNAFNHILVIAVTASAMPEDELKIRKAGFDNVLIKPISRQTLINMLIRYFPCTSVITVPENTEESLSADTAPGLSQAERLQLPVLLETLDKVLKPRWKELKNSFVLSEAEQFLLLLAEIDQKYPFRLLHKWREELSWLLESLDFEKFSEKLMLLPIITDQLNALSAAESNAEKQPENKSS